MTEFSQSWNLSRQRFDETVTGLTAEQLNWRIYPGALSIGEMALHVAGVEVFFISQLLDLELTDDQKRLAKTATDGVVNEKPFPFTADEITPELVTESLNYARGLVAPIITDPSDSIRTKQIVTALGPTADGNGALARFGFHPAYHQGQAYQIRMAPNFPKES